MQINLDYCEKLLYSGKEVSFIRGAFFYLFSLPENFEVFCRFCLPAAFTKPFADFHKEIVVIFQGPNNNALAAPRGHGKSTLVGQGITIHDVVYKKEKYIVYTSENHTKSVSFLEPLSYELKYNKRIDFIYGPMEIKRGKDESNGKDREDCYDINRIRIQALSFEKNIRGLKYGNYRPTKIIMDDIENDMRVLNPLLRRKDLDKVNKQIIPALDPINGKYKIIGTILHHDSTLVTKIRVLKGNIYKACEFLPGTTEIDPETILFPAIYSKKVLDEIKYDIGSTSFQSEYMNDPIDDTASLIKRVWVLSTFDESLTYEEEGNKYDFICQGVDFAFSDRVTADESAFVVVGKDSDGYTIISCQSKMGMSTTEQFDYIEYNSSQLNCNDNALEENSIRSMSNELRKYNFEYTLFWTGSSDAPAKEQIDPEFEGKRHSVSKINMIKRLGTIFERNFNSRKDGDGYYLRIPYKTERDKQIAHKILDECTTYALADGKLVEVGPHGNIPIALGYALERSEMEKFEFGYGMLGGEEEDDIDETD